MPNHVINHVSFTDCTPARRREILEAIQYTLYVPVRFAGEIVYWTQIPLTVTSELTLKD